MGQIEPFTLRKVDRFGSTAAPTGFWHGPGPLNSSRAPRLEEPSMRTFTLLFLLSAAVLSGCLLQPAVPNVVGAWKGQLKTGVNTTINFTLNVRNQVERSFDCDLVVNATSYPCSAGFGDVGADGAFSTSVQVASGTEFLGLTTGAILSMQAVVSGQQLTSGTASLSGQNAPWTSATFTADR
jgi:hypothetical protein